MNFDKIYIIKIIIAFISGVLWIYFRDNKCYELLPNKNILVSLIVGIWIILNYIEPLFLPIGLIICFLYSIRLR